MASPNETKSGQNLSPVEGISVLTYNIHQGKTARRRRLSLEILREAMKSLKVDVILLQEVAGLKINGKTSERAEQLEELADSLWPYFAFQKNSVFTSTYHGNAILSRYPIVEWKVINLTLAGMKKRGALHAEIQVPFWKNHLHIIGTHLGLLQYERRRQTQRLCNYIANHIPERARLVLGGDFNDWREESSKDIKAHIGLDEVFLTQDLQHAKTFPSRLPVLRLDRIYFRGFELDRAKTLQGKPWSLLSDHLPVLAKLRTA
jgi:endonuclease/exonuclease/phosphatase family metal-dependent hydrolase